MKNRLTPAAKKAFVIGGVSVATYVFNYVLRNMLSVLTPFMLREDATAYTVEYIALLSSLYMAFYAAGQLFNGVLGDRFSPKAMVLLGLLGGGAVSAAFPFLPHGVLQMLCFAVLGYGLSMVRGPLMKIISENTAAHLHVFLRGELCRSAYRRCVCHAASVAMGVRCRRLPHGSDRFFLLFCAVGAGKARISRCSCTSTKFSRKRQPCASRGRISRFDKTRPRKRCFRGRVL